MRLWAWFISFLGPRSLSKLSFHDSPRQLESPWPAWFTEAWLRYVSTAEKASMAKGIAVAKEMPHGFRLVSASLGNISIFLRHSSQ